MTKPRTPARSRNPSTQTARKQPAAQKAAPPAGPDRVGYLRPSSAWQCNEGSAVGTRRVVGCFNY